MTLPALKAATQPAEVETKTRSAPHQARIAELDGIRGIAVLAVVFYHLALWNTPTSSAEWTGLPLLLLSVVKQGWMGVHLFFVLSGFLITGILMQSKGRPRFFRNFYGRRVLRILPAYFATLIGIYLTYEGSGPFVFLSSIFLSNMTTAFGVEAIYASLWTLAVEEHFYIGWPWLVARLNRQTLLRTISSLLLVGPVLRGMRIYFGWDEAFYSWYNFDSLLWGALLALLYDNGTLFRGKLLRYSLIALALGVVGFALGAPFGLLSRKNYLGTIFQLPCIDLIFAGFVGAALSLQGTLWTSVLRPRILTTFGTLSYSLYLFHCMVITWVDRVLHNHQNLVPFPFGSLAFSATVTSVAFVGSVIVAALSYHLIESRALRYRHHFAP